MSRRILDSDGKSIRLPWPHTKLRRVSGLNIYALNPTTEKTSNPDFDPNDITRNLVAFDRDWRRRWIVESVDPPTPDVDSYYHKDLYTIDGRLLSRSNTGNFHHIHPDTGVLLDSWGPTQYKTECGICDFSEPVDDLAWHEGTTIVRTGTTLHGFHGVEKLWERNDDYEWRLSTEDGDFHIRTYVDRERSWMEFKLDTDTGDVVEPVYEVYEKTDEFMEKERQRRP